VKDSKSTTTEASRDKKRRRQKPIGQNSQHRMEWKSFTAGTKNTWKKRKKKDFFHYQKRQQPKGPRQTVVFLSLAQVESDRQGIPIIQGKKGGGPMRLGPTQKAVHAYLNPRLNNPGEKRNGGMGD